MEKHFALKQALPAFSLSIFLVKIFDSDFVFVPVVSVPFSQFHGSPV